MTKVFVGNLDYSTTPEELRELFAPTGAIVDVALPIERETGRARGFAFVTFSAEESVAKAIQTIDGTELRGRQLRVSEASPERTRRPGGFGGGGDANPFGLPAPSRRSTRSKGSRRNIRGRKRGF